MRKNIILLDILDIYVYLCPKNFPKLWYKIDRELFLNKRMNGNIKPALSRHLKGCSCLKGSSEKK